MTSKAIEYVDDNDSLGTHIIHLCIIVFPMIDELFCQLKASHFVTLDVSDRLNDLGNCSCFCLFRFARFFSRGFQYAEGGWSFRLDGTTL